MEHINQLLAWQSQLDENHGSGYADIDVARRLIKHGIESIEYASRADRKAREECHKIAADIAINVRGTAADIVWALSRTITDENETRNVQHARGHES